MASTQSKNETGENQNSFARMMRSTGAVNPVQTFANVQWGLKNLAATMAGVQRMYTFGLSLCVTISHLWEVVMHNRSHMRDPSARFCA